MKFIRYILYCSVFMTIFILTGVLPVNGAEKSGETYGKGNISITLATGTPGSLGLVKSLAEPFCDKNNCRINWINMGSGESLDALKSGKSDIIMVHAPDAEKKAVKEGWAVNRQLIGGNEFFILGPASDPAGIKDLRSVTEAYRRIAEKGALFFTRNDNSGTHKKEMMIWEMAGIKPSGSWYVATNAFMEPTLKRADEEKGYFMTDSSTYYARKEGVKNLKILLRGDPVLLNVYHIMSVPEEKRTGDIYRLITGFIGFVKSEEGQRIIHEFGMSKYGIPLYMDAKQVGSAAKL
jgi:tungstate transport system substrate-binding protein